MGPALRSRIRKALVALRAARVVVGIHAVDLVLGFGTLHCLSQQQPAE
jgi:agmatine deiminase